MPKITDYDEFEYDYSTFWNNRDYEHIAESNTLKKLFRNLTGTWFLDIGGSYGRHLPAYHQKFHNCVICDYSMIALKQARKHLKEMGITNVHLVAANVYHLPFKPQTFDTSMMIRVLHHIEDPERASSEISRVLKYGAQFILEFANKANIKALIRAVLQLNFRYIFSKEPYLRPTLGNYEGSTKDTPGIMYNFHPKYIKNLLVSHEMKVLKTYSLSFFRIPVLKKIVPKKILAAMDQVFQMLFSPAKAAPSIIVLGKKKPAANPDQYEIPVTNVQQNIEDILCCPKCHGSLNRKPHGLTCQKCALSFEVAGKIYDLRYPAPKE